VGWSADGYMTSVPEPTFHDMLGSLKKAAAALRDAGVPYAVAGGFAVWAHGGPGSDHDVDLVIREDDVDAALAAVESAGMRTERPPEGWLVKAFDGSVMVDLIFHPAGLPITDEVLSRCEDLMVGALKMPVLPAGDVLFTKLRSLTEHHLDYKGLIDVTRTLREQVNWADIRARTEDSPFARAYFTLVEGLDLISTSTPAG
jgi:hypothetical protein